MTQKLFAEFQNIKIKSSQKRLNNLQLNCKWFLDSVKLVVNVLKTRFAAK